MLQRLLQRQIVPCMHRLQALRHCQRSLRGYCLGNLLRARHQRVGRNHFLHQPDPQRFRRPIISPVRIIFSAAPFPTSRGSRCDPP